MTNVVTASEANRQFSTLLKRARDGETIAITSHGDTVAYLVPRDGAEAVETARRDAAFDAIVKRARERPVTHIGPWTRDELYD